MYKWSHRIAVTSAKRFCLWTNPAATPANRIAFRALWECAHEDDIHLTKSIMIIILINWLNTVFFSNRRLVLVK